MKVTFFSNGNTMAFDKEGNQFPELQKSWFMLYVKLLDKKGFDPTEIIFTLPNGREAVIIKTNDRDGYNWKIIN